jgi:hypothetical protein
VSKSNSEPWEPIVARQTDRMLDNGYAWFRTAILELVQQQNELFEITVVDGYTTQAGHESVRVTVRGG